MEHATESLSHYRALDQPTWEANALNQVAWCAARVGEYDTLNSLGYIAHHTGHHRRAIDHYREALALFQGIGDTCDAANTLEYLGHPHLALGEHEKAGVVWQEAVELYEEQDRAVDAVDPPRCTPS